MSDTITLVIAAVIGFSASYLVFIAGQITAKWFISPLHEFHALRGRIEFYLDFYSNLIANPSEDRTDERDLAGRDLRRLAMELRSTYYRIHFWKFKEQVGRVSTSDEVSSASASLVGLSNGLVVTGATAKGTRQENLERVKEVRKYLYLRSLTKRCNT